MLRDTGALFAELFPAQSEIPVVDDNPFEAAGAQVEESLSFRAYDNPMRSCCLLRGLYAESRFVDRTLAAIAASDAIPIAVGTINDIVKPAAHRAGRRYLCVPTAASMDG